jgi:hypothetical protein
VVVLVVVMVAVAECTCHGTDNHIDIRPFVKHIGHKIDMVVCSMACTCCDHHHDNHNHNHNHQHYHHHPENQDMPIHIQHATFGLH